MPKEAQSIGKIILASLPNDYKRKANIIHEIITTTATDMVGYCWTNLALFFNLSK